MNARIALAAFPRVVAPAAIMVDPNYPSEVARCNIEYNSPCSNSSRQMSCLLLSVLTGSVLSAKIDTELVVENETDVRRNVANPSMGVIEGAQ